MHCVSATTHEQEALILVWNPKAAENKIVVAGEGARDVDGVEGEEVVGGRRSDRVGALCREWWSCPGALRRCALQWRRHWFTKNRL